MEARAMSNVKIKREVDCFSQNWCEEEKYLQEVDFPDNASYCSRERSAGPGGKDGRGQATRGIADTVTENHLFNESPNVEYIQGRYIPRTQVQCSPHKVYAAERIPSRESFAQRTATLPDLNGRRRRKGRFPFRFHNGEYLGTEEKREWIGSHDAGLHGHLTRSPRPLNDTFHTYAANQANAWPSYPSPARPTLPEHSSFQPIPVIQIGKAFHVHTFTPGPQEQVIVRQPEEVFEMSPGNLVKPTFFNEQSTAVEESPTTDSGFSDDAGSKSDGVNDSGGLESQKTDEMEEERQWSQVFWYRDLKRPNSCNRDQTKTEKTIFMRCNELKEQRKRQAHSMSKRKNGVDSPQHYLTTPLTQQSGGSESASADSDDTDPSPKKRYLSQEQSASTLPGNLESMRGVGRARSASNDQPFYSFMSPQNCEILQDLITKESQAKSPCRKADKSDNRQNTSNNELTQDNQELLKGAQLQWTPGKTADGSNPRGASSGEHEVICQVNGLFSLPGFKDTKYNVTLGELQRRSGQPENLNRVEMISYLRQAKSSGRTLLDKHHVVTTSHSNPTILSRVCENEARVLANGIHEMNTQYLPMQSLAGKTVQEFRKRECVRDQDCGFKLRRRVVDIEITRNVLQEMQDALVVDHDAGHLRDLELASHGFGVPNLVNHLKLLDTYFDTLMKHLQDAVEKHAES